MAGAGPGGPGGAGPGPAKKSGGTGQISVGSHLLRDYPIVQLQEADPEYPESVERNPGEFRVPLSREHVACSHLECGSWGGLPGQCCGQGRRGPPPDIRQF